MRKSKKRARTHVDCFDQHESASTDHSKTQTYFPAEILVTLVLKKVFQDANCMVAWVLLLLPLSSSSCSDSFAAGLDEAAS
jgi:hypothetical protein